MKPIICKHCSAVNKHHSFQCSLVRKPIKKSVIGKCIDLVDEINIATLKKGNSLIEQAAEHQKVIDDCQRKIRAEIAKVAPKKDKSVSELLKLAEVVFNKWIRNRDKGTDGTFKCMCCGVFFSNKQMDAGHMYAKTYSSTRFHEDNVWGQSQSCNRLNYGNVKEFKLRVQEHIGEERFEALRELKNQPKKWDREELLDIIKKYKI